MKSSISKQSDSQASSLMDHGGEPSPQLYDINATPKNLDDLTEQILSLAPGDAREMIPMMIKDYLAQSFGVAYLEQTESDKFRPIEELYTKLTQRR